MCNTTQGGGTHKHTQALPVPHPPKQLTWTTQLCCSMSSIKVLHQLPDLVDVVDDEGAVTQPVQQALTAAAAKEFGHVGVHLQAVHLKGNMAATRNYNAARQAKQEECTSLAKKQYSPTSKESTWLMAV